MQHGPTIFYSLSSATAMALGDSTVDGVPVRRIKKDLIRVGNYSHPRDGWKLNVTPERIQGWLAQFSAMQKNGVDVEIVVDHGWKAEDVRGYVKALEFDGTTLYAVEEIRGAEAITLAERNKNRSIWVEPAWKDGKGNHYGECIVHDSFCQKPIATGQDEFAAIAASSEGRAAALNFSGSSNMTPEQIAAILAQVQTIVGAKTPIKTLDELPAALQTAVGAYTTKITETEAARLQLENKLKAGDKTPPDGDTLEMLGEGVEMKIGSLVENGILNKAVAASLITEFVGPKGKRNAFALSASYSGRDTSIARRIVEILGENKVPPKGTANLGDNGGHMKLSDGGGSGGTVEPAFDQKTFESMEASAYPGAK